MNEEERKKYPSLPPGYVSLALLQERWLEEKKEKKMKEENREQGKSEEMKKCPLLPPDYVSLAQLRERWLEKQKEEKMKEEEQEKRRNIDEYQNDLGFKNEEKGKNVGENQNHGGFKSVGVNRNPRVLKVEEGKSLVENQYHRGLRNVEKGKRVGENQNHRGLKNSWVEKIRCEFSRNGRQRIVKEDGCKKGDLITEGKEKEKVKETGGAEDGKERNGRKKNKGRRYRKKKHVSNGLEKNSKCEPTEGFSGEMKKNGSEVDDTLVEMKVGTWERGEGSRQEECLLEWMVEKGNVSEVEVLSGNGEKEEIANAKIREIRGGFHRNGDNLGPSYKTKEYTAKTHGLVTESEVDLEKKTEDGYRNGKAWAERRRNGVHNQEMGNESKGDIVERRSETVEKEALEVRRRLAGRMDQGRNRNWKRSKYKRYEIKENRFRVQGPIDNNTFMEQKKVGNENVLMESAKDVEKDEVSIIEENKTWDQNVVMESEKNDENEEVGNGFRGNERRNENSIREFENLTLVNRNINGRRRYEHPIRLEGWRINQRNNCLMRNRKKSEMDSGDMRTRERIQEDNLGIMPLKPRMMVAEGDDEKGEVRNGFRGSEHRRENSGKESEHLAFKYRNIGGRQRYGRPGQFESRRIKHTNNSLIWMKKEDMLSANGA